LKIYTRRGDRGETDLFGGDRVAKDDLRVQAYGDVDELNACLGLAASATVHADLIASAQRIQSSLFDLGSQLATPDRSKHEKGQVPTVGAAEIEELEELIDGLEADLEPLKSFILPGGTRAAAAFHHVRTVCRRAERSVVSLDRHEDVDAGALRYLNRLSDLLFVMARVENHRAGVADIAWVGRLRTGGSDGGPGSE
jgi:cob(I)alamin adenosyltransferase